MQKVQNKNHKTKQKQQIQNTPNQKYKNTNTKTTKIQNTTITQYQIPNIQPLKNRIQKSNLYIYTIKKQKYRQS